MESSPSQVEQAEAELIACKGRATGWDASCEQAAARLALAMAESEMDEGEMRKRLRAEGISRRGIDGLISNALRALRDREDEELAGATPLCPHCLQPIGKLDHFCPHCMGPVTAHASIDPLGQVFSAGRAYQNAVSDKPRGVVVWGMWLIFGPGLGILIFCLCMVLRDMFAPNIRSQDAFVIGEGLASGDGLATHLLQFVLVCAALVLNAAILWKVTARWIRSRRAATPA